MSLDLQVIFSCDHKVIDEPYTIDHTDRRSVRIPFPITSNPITIKVNGYPVPPDHLIYGYKVVPDERSVEPNRLSKVLFRRDLPAIDDIIELTYHSPRIYCRKCFGTNLVFDYDYSKDGDLITVIDSSKLQQDGLKGIITDLGSNPFHTWAGTELKALVGAKASNDGFIIGAIKQSVQKALRQLKNLQLQQSDYQKVSDGETLSSIDTIEVVRDQYDPTLFNINISLISASGGTAVISQSLRLSGLIINNI